MTLFLNKVILLRTAAGKKQPESSWETGTWYHPWGRFSCIIRVWKISILLSRKISTKSCFRFSNTSDLLDSTKTTRWITQIINLMNSGILWSTLREKSHDETICRSHGLHILRPWWILWNHDQCRWPWRSSTSSTPKFWINQSQRWHPILDNSQTDTRPLAKGVVLCV